MSNNEVVKILKKSPFKPLLSHNHPNIIQIEIPHRHIFNIQDLCKLTKKELLQVMWLNELSLDISVGKIAILI